MQRGAELVRNLIKVGWPEGVVLNVNFPDCEPDAVKGSAATAQGQRDPDLLRIEDRLDTRGKPITGSASSGDAPSHPRVLTSGQFVRT
jgi:5'-nucleotidase